MTGVCRRKSGSCTYGCRLGRRGEARTIACQQHDTSSLHINTYARGTGYGRRNETWRRRLRVSKFKLTFWRRIPVMSEYRDESLFMACLLCSEWPLERDGDPGEFDRHKVGQSSM